MWSIGMVSLFLVVFDWNRLDALETYDQNTVNEYIGDTFGDLFVRHKILSNDFEDFIRSCLTVEPSGRMTADASKRHRWFRTSVHCLNAQTEAFTQGWQPARIVQNAVEELVLFGSSDKPPSEPTVSSSKRNAPDDRALSLDSQKSPHFTNDSCIGHKRQKVIQAGPLIKLTPPSPGSGSTLYFA
jgi:serine/threonine protein kinase